MRSLRLLALIVGLGTATCGGANGVLTCTITCKDTSTSTVTSTGCDQAVQNACSGIGVELCSCT